MSKSKEIKVSLTEREEINVVKFLQGFLDTIPHENERGYKLAKHQQWVKGLNNGTFAELVEADPEAAIELIKRVNTGLNLMHSTENAALSTALRDYERALNVAKTLAVVLEEGFNQEALEAYFEAIRGLKSDAFTPKMTPPTSWPIASQILFLADPTRFPFVKPRKVQHTFKLMGLQRLNDEYSAKLNVKTYMAVREGYKQLQEFIEHYFSEDELKIINLIDIQTIIFILAGGYGKSVKK